VQPSEDIGFLQFKALKWLKIDAKNMKNTKTSNTNLYCNIPFPKISEKNFSREAMAPSPPLELPMHHGATFVPPILTF